MMRDIHLGVQLPFESAGDREDSEDILIRLLGLNCRANLQHLRRNPNTPRLYDAGITYAEPDQLDKKRRVTPELLLELVRLCRKMRLEPETALMMLRIAKGVEVFLDIPNLYRRGQGDCNELVPVRIAELWRGGRLDATPYLIKERNSRGGWTYHAVVHYLADNSVEDPSLILGMGGPTRRDERREEIRKNQERWLTNVAAGRQLIDQGAPANVVGRQIDMLGFVPREGVFRSPYRAVALRKAA